MNDLISRQAVLDWLKNEWNGMVTSLFDGIKALPSAQPKRTDKRTETHACDCISREAAIDGVKTLHDVAWKNWHEPTLSANVVLDMIRELPSAQPEIKPIEYRDCANAMLRMWIDNVVTDGEYNRIMDKLNAHWGMKNE